MSDSTPTPASFDDRLTRAVDTIVRPLHGTLERELKSLVADLTAAAAEQQAAALTEVRDAAAAEKEAAVREALDAAGTHHEKQLAELQRASAADKDAVLASLRETLAQEGAAALAAAVAAAKAEADASLASEREDAARRLDVARAEASGSLEAGLASLREALAQESAAALATARAEAEASVASVREEAARTLKLAQADATGSLEAAHAEIARLGQQLLTAGAEAERVTGERVAEAEALAAGRLAASLTEARADERQADLACVERLLGTIRRIDGAGSLGGVLEALADAVQAESGRVAVFLVRDGGLQGWRFGGFTPEVPDPRAVMLPIGEAGVISRAIAAHTCAATSDADLAGDTTFVPPPPGSLLHLPAGRAGLAAPVCVGGQAVAVVYADEGTVEEPVVPNAWPELVEIAARHASRCLELLMASRIVTARAAFEASPAGGRAADAAKGATGSPATAGDDDVDAARRYARLLISEIKLYHESEVNEGKRERDLLVRLKPEIERARRLYLERVPPAVRAAADCFEQELVRTLADGNEALLGLAT